MSLADVRDIVIIILFGVQSILVLLLAIAVLFIFPLLKRVERILESTQETVEIVRTRSGFVADRVTKPTIKALGTLTGVLRALNFIVTRGRRRK